MNPFTFFFSVLVILFFLGCVAAAVIFVIGGFVAIGNLARMLFRR